MEEQVAGERRSRERFGVAIDELGRVIHTSSRLTLSEYAHTSAKRFMDAVLKTVDVDGLNTMAALSSNSSTLGFAHDPSSEQMEDLGKLARSYGVSGFVSTPRRTLQFG